MNEHDRGLAETLRYAASNATTHLPEGDLAESNRARLARKLAWPVAAVCGAAVVGLVAVIGQPGAGPGGPPPAAPNSSASETTDETADDGPADVEDQITWQDRVAPYADSLAESAKAAGNYSGLRLHTAHRSVELLGVGDPASDTVALLDSPPPGTSVVWTSVPFTRLEIDSAADALTQKADVWSMDEAPDFGGLRVRYDPSRMTEHPSEILGVPIVWVAAAEPSIF